VTAQMWILWIFNSIYQDEESNANSGKERSLPPKLGYGQLKMQKLGPLESWESPSYHSLCWTKIYSSSYTNLS